MRRGRMRRRTYTTKAERISLTTTNQPGLQDLLRIYMKLGHIESFVPAKPKNKLPAES
jgi:hypothetical protein